MLKNVVPKTKKKQNSTHRCYSAAPAPALASTSKTLPSFSSQGPEESVCSGVSGGIEYKTSRVGFRFLDWTGGKNNIRLFR